jgi:hypothetical protein
MERNHRQLVEYLNKGAKRTNSKKQSSWERFGVYNEQADDSIVIFCKLMAYSNLGWVPLGRLNWWYLKRFQHILSVTNKGCFNLWEIEV